MNPFPIHFAIDLEPDKRLPEDSDKTFDNAGVALERMAIWRDRIEAVTGAPAQFGWYVRMDRHIGALYGDPCTIAKRYKPLLDEAARAGDEIGLHIHAIERRPGGGWRANYADEFAVCETVSESFANFKTVFGRNCISARMGDMWTSEACMRKIVECGARYDLSLETGRCPKAMAALYPGTGSKGWRPSMVGAPLTPFQPDEASEPGFWAVPLASHPRRDSPLLRVLVLSAYSAAATGFRRIRARKTLRPQEHYQPGELQASLNAAINEGKQPGFCLAIRNYDDAAQTDNFIEALLNFARERPVKFCAPAEYVRLAMAAG